MASCPTNPQPPDIEELCKQDKPRVQQRRRTMTLQEREPKHITNNNINMSNNVRGLPRSVSDMNVVAFCTCQQSKDFPFCDNTHAIFNKATNSNMAPLYVAFVEGDKCNDCASKDKNKLSHSVDQTISHKRGSIIQSPNNNKLHISADVLTTSYCKCKLSSPNSSNDTLSSQNIEKQHTPNKNISSSPSTPSETTTISTPTSSPSTNTTTIDKSTVSTPTPTPTPKSITTIQNKEETTTEDEDSDTCTTTTTKVYTPSNARSPTNKDNIITRAEVAEHASLNDLWMIIKGNVYDITDYVQYHPGGVRALVKFAGQDGTENVHYHSSRMLELLNSHYFIGKLPKHEGGGGGGCTIS